VINGSQSVGIGTATPKALAEVSGSVTDAAGAAVPGASVALRSLAGTSINNASTDETGKFQIADLSPGKYELRIQARGFRAETRQIDVQPQKPAVVASVLEVGASTETVEVTAASTAISADATTLSSVLSTESISSLPLQARALPGNLPATTTVAIGKLVLAVDSNGGLYLSKTSGKNWSGVKPPWKDHVTGLVIVPKSVTSPAVFQVTTESGSIWQSRDGTHWQPANATTGKKN
jgi:hypothetical protein